MAYHIYHTEAVILGGRSHGEGDRVLYCYTRELGLVSAHAKSLREHRSRLRYALQTFAHAEIDLIRGKHGWKLISARPIDSFASLWRHPAKRHIIAEHAHLVRRLVQGEERHELLFDELMDGLRYLSGLEEEGELRAAELIAAVRVLVHLGYWGRDLPSEEDGAVVQEVGAHVPLYSEDPWSQSTLEYATAMRTPLLAEVNRALRESQL